MAAAQELTPSQPAPASQADQSSPPTVAELNAASVARQQAVVAKAREQLREARGVPVPEASPAPPSPAPPPAATPAPATQPAPLLDAAETFRKEAIKMKTEADARVAAAEAKLAASKELAGKKPVEWLKENGYDLDSWQARLLNGGEQAPHEIADEKLEARIKAAEDRAVKAEQVASQFVYEEKKGRALAQLTPALTAEFPLVAHFMGPEEALNSITRASQQAGKVLDPKVFFKDIESRFLEQYRAPLSNPQVAASLKLSELKSPPVEVAESPRTLTNRVTSTVTPHSTRPGSDAERIARGREMIRKLYAAGQ